MEKKIYERPFMRVERFIPNEFLAACPRPNTWVATCDPYSSLIFYGNPSGPYDLQCDLNRGGCGQSHEFTLENGLKPEANCWILQGVSGRTPYSNDNLEENKALFTDASWSAYSRSGSVTSLVLKEEYKDRLIAAYVNTEVLDGVLLTSDIKNIKNPS